MRNSRAMAATATLLAVLAAAGCSGGSSGGGSSSTASHRTNPGTSSGEPAPPQTSTSSSATATSPSSSATPSSSGTAAGAPGVPDAARQHTEAGAVAFARHYWDTVNKTAVEPKVDVLEKLATDSCKTCRNFAETVRSNVQDGQKFSGPEGKILESEWRANAVWMKIEPMDVDLIDADTGAVVKHYPKDPVYIWVIDLRWTAAGWRVNSMQVADSSSW